MRSVPVRLAALLFLAALLSGSGGLGPSGCGDGGVKRDPYPAHLGGSWSVQLADTMTYEVIWPHEAEDARGTTSNTGGTIDVGPGELALDCGDDRIICPAEVLVLVEGSQWVIEQVDAGRIEFSAREQSGECDPGAAPLDEYWCEGDFLPTQETVVGQFVDDWADERGVLTVHLPIDSPFASGELARQCFANTFVYGEFFAVEETPSRPTATRLEGEIEVEIALSCFTLVDGGHAADPGDGPMLTLTLGFQAERSEG